MLLVSTGWYICTVIAALCTLLGPVIAIIIAKRKLHVPWRYFFYGALIFFLFQVISRVPLVSLLGLAVGKTVNDSPLLFAFWGVFLALTAGLCEEWGRYVGYRWLLKRAPKTWNTGVAYGLGHASLESMLLVGLNLVVLVIEIAIFSFAPVPASQQATVTQLVHTLGSQSDWSPLVAVWERLWTILFHIAMSVLVLQSIRQQNARFVWLAVLFHTILDTCAALLPHYLGGVTGLLIVEVVVCISGLLAFWWLRRTRQRMNEEDAANELLTSVDPLLSASKE